MMMAAVVSGDGEDSGGVDEWVVFPSVKAALLQSSSTTDSGQTFVENLSNLPTLVGAKHANRK